METQCFEWKFRWGARNEKPDALANRLCKTIDGFALLYPERTQWFWGDTAELLESEGEIGRYPLATIRPDMPEAIKRNACVMDGYDEAFPEDGFFFVVGTNVDDDHLEKGLLVTGGVGSTRRLNDFANDLSFRAGNDIAPSYATFRDTTILLAETWEVTCGVQCPPGLTADRQTGWLKAGWMAYLSPKAAEISERPSGLIVEERPNGGLFLAATNEIFDPHGLAQAIEHNVCCEDDRNYTPDPDRGYFLFAASGEGEEPNYIHFCASAAGIDSSYVTPFINSASIGFAANGARHDLLTFDTVKSLLLIVAETWEASSGFASARHSFDMALAGKGFKWGWMTYLSPYFARLIEPPCDTILEYRPNGGLFMAATTEVYDPANPVHYDAALAIRDALAPLNELENPIDQPYR